MCKALTRAHVVPLHTRTYECMAIFNVLLYSNMIKAEFPEYLKVYIGLLGTRFLSTSFCVDRPNSVPINTVPC